MTKPVKANDVVHCYVALGSNLGDSTEYLHKAISAIKSRPDIQSLNISHFYQSKPHGPQDQSDYINAVINFETSLGAEELLDVLQQIENDHGRARENIERWGARTLDLDLLFYGDKVIDTPRLTVPHPRICERAFVLYPLRDLVDANTYKDLKINKTATLQNCIDNLSEAEINNIKDLGYV